MLDTLPTPPFRFHYMTLGAGVAIPIAVEQNENFSSRHWSPFCFNLSKEYFLQRGACQEVYCQTYLHCFC
jgi:hypothetical protein